MNAENRERMPFRMKPETKMNIERWYRADNCKSQNEFIEKAVNFYADWLSAGRNAILPQAIATAIDGRLSILEDNLRSLSFNHSLAQEMTTSILARAFEFDRDELAKIRAESVQNVKRTNGRISLEKHVFGKWEDE